MKILVTGSNGFIAGHTIEELESRGYQTIGFTRQLNQLNPIRTDITYIGDLKDAEAVEKAVSMSDGVINLAGILGTQETVNNPIPAVEVNILGALNVLNACTLWKKPLIQIAVGNHWMNNSYSITKTTTERFCDMYAKERGTKVDVVRALNAFGERQKAAPVRKIIPSFITRALKGEDIEIYGDGSQLMDMIYVKDLAKILVDSLENMQSGGKLIEAGTGMGISVKDIAKTIISLTGSTSQIKHLPMRPGEKVGDNDVIAQNPCKFEQTDFITALTRTIKWYESA